MIILVCIGLYALLYSTTVFEKIVGKYAPEFGIHYDRIHGSITEGVTLEGVYYKEKKLAREIGFSLNPSGLIQGELHLSHIRLMGVNEGYLEYMIDDFSTPAEESNERSSIPLSLYLEDIALSLLPFHIAGIDFRQAQLKVASIRYSQEKFSFGALQLQAETSLGEAKLSGHYQKRDLYLDTLSIEKLNTMAIETLLAKPKEATVENQNKESNTSASLFVPEHLFVDRLQVGILPRKYQGVLLSLLQLSGEQVVVDLFNEQLQGKVTLSLVSDLARGSVVGRIGVDQIDIHDANLTDINLSQILVWTSGIGDANSTNIQAHTEQKSQHEGNRSIPYLPQKLALKRMHVALLPDQYATVDWHDLNLTLSDLEMDLSSYYLKHAGVDLIADSSLGKLSHRGEVIDEKLHSILTLEPTEKLFATYAPRLRVAALPQIMIEMITDKKQMEANLSLEAKSLFKEPEKSVALDLNQLAIQMQYGFADAALSAEITGDITTPYFPHAQIQTQVTYKNTLHYTGTLSLPKLTGMDPHVAEMLTKTQVMFEGGMKQFSANLKSRMLKGTLQSNTMREAQLHLESRDQIVLSTLLKLPKSIEEARASFVLDIPVDFNQTLPLHAHAKISSDLLDIDSNIVYSDTLDVQACTTLPAHTLLSGLLPEFKWKAIDNLQLHLTQKKNTFLLKAKNKALSLSAVYGIENGHIMVDTSLPSTKIALSGIPQKQLKLTVSTSSIKNMQQGIRKFYPWKGAEIEGDIKLTANINQLSSATIALQSKQLKFGKGKNASKIKSLSLRAEGDMQVWVLKQYALETQGAKIYANKPSKVVIEKEQIRVDPLWINDQLRTIGSYHLKSGKAVLNSTASAFPIDHTLVKLMTALGVKTTMKGEKIALSGSIDLQGGRLYYDLNKKRFAADSDIIILQRQQKKNSGFEKNVAINLTLNSSKPLEYKQKGIAIKLVPKLKIKKRYGKPLKIFGKVTLEKGGYYLFENKKFILQKSAIYFKGKPTAPILNINILYKHTGTTIRVKISGTASDPVLHFSSDPQMSREEILSYILFDTSSGGQNNKAGEVTNLVAGTLVKSLFANMGLKLDHLVLSGAGFEVGKKISDRITVIYDQSDKSAIKLRIENTKHIETDISFGRESQSADIFYKREF